MRILGISSATKIISLALVDEEKILFETTVSEISSEKITFYLSAAQIRPEQIEGIAVAAGPGSYSGLRGGLSIAKSMAQALNIPLIGVSTLEAMAYNLVDSEGTIAALLSARLDEYNFALFGASCGKLNRLTDDLVVKLDKLNQTLANIAGKIYLAGNTADLKLSGDNFHFAEEIHSHPYGINVARVGIIKMKSGKKDDLLSLTPRYSHQPNIREFKS